MSLRIGVYRKKRTGHLYQFLLLARNHYSGEHVVVYIPLRIEPEWAGTIRPCWIPRGDFESKFEYVGEGLPTPVGIPAAGISDR
jgi:hypothetical protein